MINWEEISFKIISKVGEAKHIATEAFKMGKNKKFQEAYQLIEKANKLINEAGSEHMEVIQKEAQGVKHDFSVLFIHAEDQFLSTQTFVLSTKMLIEVIELNEK